MSNQLKADEPGSDFVLIVARRGVCVRKLCQQLLTKSRLVAQHAFKGFYNHSICLHMEAERSIHANGTQAMGEIKPQAVHSLAR